MTLAEGAFEALVGELEAEVPAAVDAAADAAAAAEAEAEAAALALGPPREEERRAGMLLVF